MTLIRWFESKQNWVNILTVVLGASTFALAQIGMLGLTQTVAYGATVALMLVNGGIQLYLKNTSTSIVGSKDEVAADRAGPTP